MPQTPLPPPIFSGTELYDAIMAGIEPELVTANLSNIAAMTQNETKAKRQQRATRYMAAFETYDQTMRGYIREWNAAFHGYKTSARKALEQATTSTEGADITSLEQSIQAQ